MSTQQITVSVKFRTGSGAHPSSCTVDTGVLSWGVKSTTHLHIVWWLRMSGGCTCSLSVCLYLSAVTFMLRGKLCRNYCSVWRAFLKIVLALVTSLLLSVFPSIYLYAWNNSVWISDNAGIRFSMRPCYMPSPSLFNICCPNNNNSSSSNNRLFHIFSLLCLCYSLF